MIWKLTYTTEARADLRGISDYIADESGSEDVAESFIVQLDERCRRLASLPGTLGTARPELRKDVRSTPHKSYVIFFRYADDALEIVNVLRANRNLSAYFGVEE